MKRRTKALLAMVPITALALWLDALEPGQGTFYNPMFWARSQYAKLTDGWAEAKQFDLTDPRLRECAALASENMINFAQEEGRKIITGKSEAVALTQLGTPTCILELGVYRWLSESGLSVDVSFDDGGRVAKVGLTKPTPQKAATPAPSREQKDLPQLVNQLIQIAAQQGLPTDRLSISILDVASGQAANHNGDVQRYPASIIKLFWAAAALERGHREPIHNAVHDSDNEAANQLLEAVGRKEMQSFWATAGFVGNYQHPVNAQRIEAIPRNSLATNDVVNFLAQLSANQRWASIKAAMAHDIEADRDVPHGAIRGYVGQDLPAGTAFWTKAGWTSEVRSEAALVELGGRLYAISIIAESSEYAASETIFPAFGYEIYHALN